MVNGPTDAEGADRGGIRRRHHVGDRFDIAAAEPQGRPRQFTMSGKFLLYKYCDASRNMLEYGFKEG
jgi:hypothetical protein